MHDTRERLSLFWIFALLNQLYADVVALFAIAGSRNSFEPSPPMGSDGSAVGFYERLGYTVAGEEFVDVTVPHVRMTRSL